jgi:6-phosphofructokinase 1
VRKGYDGLIGGDYFALDSRVVGGIMQRGGTFLGTARSAAFETPAGQEQAVAQIARAGIEGLVIIGGNGSLRGALALHERGVPVVGVPKTIDNDQYGTDIAIGVDTALNTIVDAIGKVKDTASSHHRAFLIETMGRNCGYLALMSSIASGAELALIPEHPVSPEAVAVVIEQAYRLGKSHCIIVVAEGWQPGMRALQAHLRNNDRDEGFDVREVVLGHVQRGGAPTAFDRMLATRLGVFAAERLLDGTGHGMLAGWHGNRVGLMPLREATAGCRELDPEWVQIATTLAT